MTTLAAPARWFGCSRLAVFRAAVKWRISSGLASRSMRAAFLFEDFQDHALWFVPELFRHDFQIIEVGAGVGLRPQANFAGIFECVVCGLDLLRSVVVANELVAYSLHTQLM